MSIYSETARVVYDRIDEKTRVGVAFGPEILWTGSVDLKEGGLVPYGVAVGFANELASRWNNGIRENTP